ncbi:protein AUXIN RESPONSE 4 isoform X2 [Magnolia sinica]|uniref:protein AUXIN RESPONSE 4 isoform X2 n=1 Tax=Magnolia sinica TaxID=86752 RepID=UPI002659B064|nr:protein AUXIN RESPONSE 4 isoform X2 [Magnolia sinica]
MATITEEEEKEEQNQNKSENPNPKQDKTKFSQIAFSFWAYFTFSVSLLALLFSSLSSLSPQNEKSWFLSLPDDLRLHHSKGKTIKVQLNPNTLPFQIFAVEYGPRRAEAVLIVHGFGSNSYSFRHVVRSLGSAGFRAVAIDLPGSGFSDKAVLEEEEREGGILDRVLDIYNDITEKGLFWGFDRLIETGRIPYEEKEVRVSTRKSFKPLGLRSDEVGRVIGQVISSMGLAPVHLVLHDSALGAGAIWASENPGAVSSVMVVDSAVGSLALPMWVLEMPVVREIVLGFPLAYTALLRWCCSRSVERSAAEAHRILLKGKDGRKAVVGFGKGLNHSFDLGEWAGLETMRDVPMQVLWSDSWSEGWIEEGRRVAGMVPGAKFVTHSGGRWPQEDAADEVAEKIAQFVSSLPKSVRQIEEEPMPEHIQKMFNEANAGHHHHHHGHGGHDPHGGHEHVHAAGYMDAYGLGHGWGT